MSPRRASPVQQLRCVLRSFLLTAFVVSSVGESTGVELPPPMASPPCVSCRENVGEIRSRYSLTDWRAIQDHEVLVAEIETEGTTSLRRTIEVAALISHPPADVWRVLVDFGARTAWQPGAKEVALVRVDGNRAWVDEYMRFFWIGVRYRIINTLEPELGLVRFTMDESVDHDIGGTTGVWRLTPMTDNRGTLVTYRAWIDIGHPLPGSIQSMLLKRSLPSMISGLRAEVDRRSASK